ncbi:MAG: YkgJ family cysteine cluster protein [Thermodesulfovibrionales bacterium]|nr:YkgJ family cysteine cluster protein [Thermodesulfovibrionales bacterium]
MLSMRSVEPVKLTLKSPFKFKCHKSIECFTRCCRNIQILLTPYDIIRLKNKLGITTGEFLNDYTYIEIEEKSSHPFVFLKMIDDDKRSCPFVYEGGCKIYDDRPANCRYYPVGQASLKKIDQEINQPITEEFYFFVKEEHCKGFNESKTWTIEQWREDQGVDIYDEINREWKEILFRRNLPGHMLDDVKQKTFYMACYDIDRFRRYIFESRFLEVFDIEESILSKIKNDEIELMKFGFSYTKFILMMDNNLKLKQ